MQEDMLDLPMNYVNQAMLYIVMILEGMVSLRLMMLLKESLLIQMVFKSFLRIKMK